MQFEVLKIEKKKTNLDIPLKKKLKN